MSDKEIGWLWLPTHTGVEVGQTLTTEGSLKYASPRALDALAHASGPVICWVELSGKVLAMADATTVLHEFGCWCAEQELLREREAGHEPKPRSWKAIEAKRKWLKGEVTTDELNAACNAASVEFGDAALAAAAAADIDAAKAAYRASKYAARSAAWDVSLTGRGPAAWVATLAATCAAARTAQNAKLEAMLTALLKEGEK